MFEMNQFLDGVRMAKGEPSQAPSQSEVILTDYARDPQAGEPGEERTHGTRSCSGRRSWHAVFGFGRARPVGMGT